MRVLVFSITVLLNFVLQTTVMRGIAVSDVIPNTALCIVISYAILRGDIEGAIMGFFAGLMQDIFFGRYIGFYALSYSLLGFLCGKPFRDFFPENYFMPLILTAICSLLNNAAFYTFNFLMRDKLDFTYYFFKVILPEALYTVLAAAFLYKVVYAINKKVMKFEMKRRKLF